MQNTYVSGFRQAQANCRSHNPEEQEGLSPAYTCPSCGQDFCDSCTDLEAWRHDRWKACPHCGHIPRGR